MQSIKNTKNKIATSAAQFAVFAQSGWVFVTDDHIQYSQILEVGHRAYLCAGWDIEKFCENLVDSKEYIDHAKINAGVIFAPSKYSEPVDDGIINFLEESGVNAFPHADERDMVNINFDIDPNYIDADGKFPFSEDLKRTIGAANAMLAKKQDDYFNEAVGGEISQNQFAAFRNKRAGGRIKTGFTTLDDIKKGIGGLHPGLYVLGSTSSTGKTSFFMQTAENIAAQNIDVIMVSLEMGKTTMIARGISRMSYLLAHKENSEGQTIYYENEIVSYDDVVYNRNTMTPETHANYERAEKEYFKRTARLWIIDGATSRDINVCTIERIIRRHIASVGKRPFVLFIDYLQLLKALKPTHTDKQRIDDAVTRLQRLAIKYDAPIITISAVTKQASYTSLTLDSFRESSSIGYSAEVALGLQGRGMFKNDVTEENAKLGRVITNDSITEKHRKVEITILKNREGAPSSRVIKRAAYVDDNGKKQPPDIEQFHVINLNYIPEFFHFEEDIES